MLLIEDRRGKRAWGISPGYEIPKKYIELAMRDSIKGCFRKIFSDMPSGEIVITKSIYTRKKLVTMSTIMALSRFNWP